MKECAREDCMMYATCHYPKGLRTLLEEFPQTSYNAHNKVTQFGMITQSVYRVDCIDRLRYQFL